MEEPDAYSLFARGRRLLAEGHAHQAALILERAAGIEPRKGSIREALARALFNSGQFERAREEFALVVEIDPSNDYGHFGLALCHARAGELDVARGHLKMAIAMRPEVEAYQEALQRLAR